MKIPRFRLAAIAALLAANLSAQPAPRADTAALQRLLVAEDARGTGREGIAPIIEALTSRDTLLRRVAVRAAGRLQRPALGQRLYALLDDASPSIRAEVANAIAQSLRNVGRGDTTNPVAQRIVVESRRKLTGTLARERDAVAAGIIARSLGRLPFADSAAARLAERAIVVSGRAGVRGEPRYDQRARVVSTRVGAAVHGNLVVGCCGAAASYGFIGARG